ncbi:Anti-Muellerian hormone type-2 receptor, partial [Clarias magur]
SSFGRLQGRSLRVKAIPPHNVNNFQVRGTPKQKKPLCEHVFVQESGTEGQNRKTALREDVSKISAVKDRFCR